MSGQQLSRNIGEVFSTNPLYSGIKSAVDGKLQWLEVFKTNLLMPEDVAFILSKSGVHPLKDDKDMSVARKYADRQACMCMNACNYMALSMLCKLPLTLWLCYYYKSIHTATSPRQCISYTNFWDHTETLSMSTSKLHTQITTFQAMRY